MQRVVRMILASLALGLSVAVASGQSLESPPTSQHEPRWRVRQRAGVLVKALHEPSSADLATGDLRAGSPGELDARELRQLGARPRGLSLRQPWRWPAEPAAEAGWSEARFAKALRALCPVTVADARVQQIAHLALGFARELDIDPSLLAAIAYQQSQCDASHANSWGVGLAMLNKGLFPRSMERGVYVYRRRREGRWRRAKLRADIYPFTSKSLRDPAANLYFAAVQLRVLAEQCPDLDGGRGSREHRHFVSHFIWGDVVKDASAEDRILEARRRLLQYYRDLRPEAWAQLGSVVLGSPLDGAPRVATSGLEDVRDRGKRPHLGIDFLSRYGEPVRAVADGRVLYAGTDLRDGSKRNVAPSKASLVPPGAMGPRGLFVEIEHAEGLRSVYAHLSAYGVQAGQSVRRGELLGFVGRSGIKASDPHLHFGLFRGDNVLDPVRVLADAVFGPDALALRREGSEARLATGGRH